MPPGAVLGGLREFDAASGMRPAFPGIPWHRRFLISRPPLAVLREQLGGPANDPSLPSAQRGSATTGYRLAPYGRWGRPSGGRRVSRIIGGGTPPLHMGGR